LSQFSPNDDNQSTTTRQHFNTLLESILLTK